MEQQRSRRRYGTDVGPAGIVVIRKLPDTFSGGGVTDNAYAEQVSIRVTVLTAEDIRDGLPCRICAVFGDTRKDTIVERRCIVDGYDVATAIGNR